MYPDGTHELVYDFDQSQVPGTSLLVDAAPRASSLTLSRSPVYNKLDLNPTARNVRVFCGVVPKQNVNNVAVVPLVSPCEAVCMLGTD